MHLSVPSIVFFCMSEVICSFKSLRAGSHVFSLRMLFLCVILHTMWAGTRRPVLCVLMIDVCCNEFNVVSNECNELLSEKCVFVYCVESFAHIDKFYYLNNSNIENETHSLPNIHIIFKEVLRVNACDIN